MAEEVRARSARDPAVRLLRNDPPHGFGYAVRRGLDAFNADVVAIMMADGSDDADVHVRDCFAVRTERKTHSGRG